MSDKQLTVAELLARASNDNPNAEKPRRRRRRSLEEGGISIAELTGSIPAVQEKPAESRHSSVPIDAPAKSVDAKASTATSEVKAPSAASKAAPSVDTSTGTSAEKKAAVSEPKKAPVVPAKEEASSPKETKPASIQPTQKSTDPAKEQSSSTGTAKATPATDATVVLQKIEDVESPASGDSAQVSKSPVEPRGGLSVDETGEIPKVAQEPTPLVVEESTDRLAEEAPTEEAEDSLGDQEHTSVVGVVLLSLIGVVLGAVVFKGFELLWANLSWAIVAALAVVVTVAMVGTVKMLRTANDGLSMFLAAIVGGLMTFGPLLIVAL
ncbi:hypothetical protein [Corynebacterium alimapuense]|uniref:Uncharacterized protein n=1 Tax=Corynebacterium alimapuense TaxID=1576874 RepID=A0A3M8K8V2_9CORY|nr:hypothetical protein [Corynebacterium alimapuense]RNE48962.1 hypothetical protein C5L39_06675 [Corynebacterium alimapuense]